MSYTSRRLANIGKFVRSHISRTLQRIVFKLRVFPKFDIGNWSVEVVFLAFVNLGLTDLAFVNLGV